jgi:hypothetical protein
LASDPSLEVKQAKAHAFLNGKYHADREAFLDSWDKLITFGVLLAGAVAFADIFGSSSQKVGAALISLFAFLQLVYSLQLKVRKHSEQRMKYFEIAARLEVGSLTAAEALADMIRLSGEEDPPYFAVHALAENWATRAVFGDDRPFPCKVSWLRNKLRHYVRQDGHDFSVSHEVDLTPAPGSSLRHP